jgi:subfamily B ATP-binding cassette protein MsbA
MFTNASNLDGSRDRCYGFAAVASRDDSATFMSKEKRTKEKQSFWQTLQAASSSYRRLYSYVKPYKVRFGLGLASGFAFGIVSSLLPVAVARVTSTVFHGAAPNPMALRSNLHALDAGPKINSIVLICLAIPVIMTLRSLCSYGNSYFMQWVSNKVITDIRTQLFNKMVRHSMDFFNKMRSGFLMSCVTNNTRVMQMALTSVSSDLFKQPVAVIGGIIVLLLMDWKFTVVALILLPACLLPIRSYGLRAKKAVRNEQEGMSEMVVTMQETFAGIRVVKSFAREAHQEKEFKRANESQFANVMRIQRATEAVGPLVETMAAIGVGMALLYVYAANLSAGRFFGLISGIFILYDPIKTLSRIHIVMQRSIAATAGIFEILDSEPTVQDAPDAAVLTSSQGRIDFENVRFRYANTATDAISNLNLGIERGKTYALVGASGAGKSTILSLILRLYDPTSGTVKIDGRDLRTVTQKSLRGQIGLVTQETFLFHDTIFKNIQFGRLDATPEEIYEAAHTASAHDFIMAQPKGYETVIGDKGCLLSGGQQQRIAIARAVLKNAPILLLDEATSSLDSESEMQIQKALEKLAAGRTVIAIAHRLSTILSADQIVVMDSGRIKESGTHSELLEKSGYYRRLYDHQFNRGQEESTVEPGILVEELV